MWDQTTALFGGTFDPPHLGHRTAVFDLLKRPGFKEVWVIPTGDPALKKTGTPGRVRLKLAEKNFEGTPRVKVLPIEIERAERSPGQPSYSYDTITTLLQSNPNLAFVIGTDQLRDLPRWHRFPELLSLCHWVVLERKGMKDGAYELLGALSAQKLLDPVDSGNLWKVARSGKSILRLETPAPELSSTAIRQSIALTGAPPEGALSPSVLEELKTQRVYGMKPDL